MGLGHKHHWNGSVYMGTALTGPPWLARPDIALSSCASRHNDFVCSHLTNATIICDSTIMHVLDVTAGTVFLAGHAYAAQAVIRLQHIIYNSLISAAVTGLGAQS